MASSPQALGAKGTRTRSALLEHAIRRFAADGFRQTSVSEIARDAGVTPAAAYAYFENKDALFAAAVDADAAGLIEQALPDILHGAFAADWQGLLEALITSLAGHPLARRILSGREPAHTERLIDIPALAELRHGIAEHLALGQQAGVVRVDIDLPLVASGLTTVVMSILIAVLRTGVRPGGELAAGVAALLDAAILDQGTTIRGGSVTP